MLERIQQSAKSESAFLGVGSYNQNNETIVRVIGYYFEFIGRGERSGFPHIGFGPQSNLLINLYAIF